jgi:ankyrin repeat protein
LLNAGADPGVRTDAGLTAADMARDKGHTEIADMLEARKPPAG